MKCNTTGTTVTFTFDGLDAITFNATKAAPAMRAYAEMHGWEQRLRDNAAIARKQRDGSVITVTEAMRRDAIAELVNHYEGGATSWTVKAGAVRSLNPTWLALAERRGVSYDVVAAEKAAADLAELEAM